MFKVSTLPQSIVGLDLSSEAYFLARLFESNSEKSFILITPDLKSGITLKQNLEFFLGSKNAHSVLWFPPHDSLPYTGLVSGTDTMAERMKTLTALLSKEPNILVVPWPALSRKMIPPSILRHYQRTLFLVDEVHREELVSWLINAGYTQEVVVESPGDFALRGALIDIFPPQEEYPFRLEFEGDYLMGIRQFDPATQTSLKTKDHLSQITIIPANEIVFDEASVDHAVKQIKMWSDAQDLPATLRREVVERIEQKRGFAGLETFLPTFYEKSATLFDYLDPETVLFLPDTDELKDIYKKNLEEMKGLHQNTKSLEKIVPPEELLSSFEKLEEEWRKHSTIFINPLFVPQGEEPHRVRIENSLHLKKQWSFDKLKEWQKLNFKIRLVCHTPIQAERLQDLLRSHGISGLPVEVGSLSHGFEWPDEGLIVLTEEEIFGHKMVRRTKSAKENLPFVSFQELNAGDVLVHEEQGVCRYQGLVHLKIHKEVGDFLYLEFFGGDKLYLPIYRLNAVQRYIGGSTPHLDKLGGVRWQQIKKKAGIQIEKIASELLKIHAQRELHPGLSFPAPDTLDEEFAAQFPFDETPDQAKAIADVLRDMQNPKPMDRLICGDVGYGKTEVAMRAAFKAVNAGKQVILLVPTTILALQHFETFQERFSKFSISVEMLSRFRSRAEQKQTLANLAEGKVDIVIGTHRLLGKDVKIKNLGLLIIDEEHRFGVKHKERIKSIRPTVDVVNLSATPIPRTLHMSLIGLKDLSIIHTPPVDRLAIRTFVARWDDAVVRYAVEQELARGGHVFFVHNRVATIEGMRKRLSGLFPNASIAVAHGQMDEEELEKVMISFLHQKTQILLTTTIIESGIDVPTANTMIINRADTFGLAQLYQLRGRVGRSDVQAFCYLLVPDEEMVTKDARQRLNALTRYTELGAGFQIASHDLEIRGSGNLLGADQSGFVEEIGYELYTKLLARTIRKLKGEKLDEEIDPEIQLGSPAFIPEEYIADAPLRMELYKRISHLANEEAIQSFRQELVDRFGPFPAPVESLLEVIALKQLAVQLSLKSLKFDGERFALVWDSSPSVSPAKLVMLAQKNPARYQLKPSGLFLVKAPLEEAKKALRALVE